MQIRLSFLKDGELVAEAFADIPGEGDIARAGRIVIEDVRRLRSGVVDLLEDNVTSYLEILSDDDAKRS